MDENMKARLMKFWPVAVSIAKQHGLVCQEVDYDYPQILLVRTSTNSPPKSVLVIAPSNDGFFSLSAVDVRSGEQYLINNKYLPEQSDLLLNGVDIALAWARARTP